MQLSVRDVARLMHVSERTVNRWVHGAGLRARLIAGQFRFNRAELFEWATIHKMRLPADLLNEESNGAPDGSCLATALELGGILYDVEGNDKPSTLASVVERMSLPAGTDRSFLLEMMLNREHLGSTSVGDGIAIPHPRYPVVLSAPEPRVGLCFLRCPVEFASRDGRPVDTLFLLIAPTVRCHLRLLTQLAIALQDDTFRGLVRGKSPAADILRESRRFQCASAKVGAADPE